MRDDIASFLFSERKVHLDANEYSIDNSNILKPAEGSLWHIDSPSYRHMEQPARKEETEFFNVRALSK